MTNIFVSWWPIKMSNITLQNVELIISSPEHWDDFMAITVKFVLIETNKWQT
jgi:hypothetical protein